MRIGCAPARLCICMRPCKRSCVRASERTLGKRPPGEENIEKDRGIRRVADPHLSCRISLMPPGGLRNVVLEGQVEEWGVR